MAEKRDYYDILGIKRDASAETIKKAFRKLAKSITRIPMPVIPRQSRCLRMSTKPIRS